MFNKTEQEIMKDWDLSLSSKPLVSVICKTFNQKKFIAKAIDRFLSQKTNFPFEIIIHDDASTDGTSDIVREYAEKYPKLVKAIIQKENQYSQKHPKTNAMIEEVMDGVYAAICEGDDYWCDDEKLQKQYDFMQAHPECSLCVHNTVIHDMSGKEDDKLFVDWQEVHKMQPEEVFFGWLVHTSSYLLTRECYSHLDFIIRFWSGDYVWLTLGMYYGDVYYIPGAMSVYNSNVKTGSTAVTGSNNEVRLRRIRARIGYLEKYNEFTKGKYNDIVQARISEIVIKTSDDYRELKAAAKSMAHNPCFDAVCKNGSKNDYYKNIWKYKGYVLGPIWYLSVRLRHKKENSKHL
jgi:glycosyltransferase involved in cell wall biosynthesis